MQIFSRTQKIVDSDEAKLGRGILSIVTQLINNNAPERLAQEFCNIFTANTDKISLAWLWFGNPHEEVIRPQYCSGVAKSYAQSSVISRNFVTNYGPFFKALDGEPTVSFSISRTSVYSPWRALNRDFGVRSAIAIRLFSELNNQVGILVLYATEVDYFEKIGLEFFEKIGPLVGAILAQNAITAELERKANTDMLTGLANRAHSISIFAHLTEDRKTNDKRQSEDVGNSVIMFDIDQFKVINNTYGYTVGDAVITEVARRAKAAVRDSDTVIRWGGEEFLVVAYKTNLMQAEIVAEKIRTAISDLEITVNNVGLKVTVSLGVASIHPHEIISDTIARADAKLYMSKTNGRNRVTS